MRTLKKLFLLILLCGFSILAYSQNQKFKVSLQGGWMTDGNISKNKMKESGFEDQSGWNAGADISYYVTKHFFAGVHFNYGNILYLQNVMDRGSDTFYRNDGKVNGTLEIENIGVFAGYCLPLSSLVNITGQTGFAQYIELDSYPRVEYFPDERFSAGFSSTINDQRDVFLSASFPVKFSIGITPFKKLNAGFAKNIEIAYAFGWYIEPDYGFFVGIYHGPQLSISF